MDQFRKRSLVRVLSRDDPDRSQYDSSVARSSEAESGFSLLGIDEEGGEKGPLGLNTLYEPQEATPVVDIIFVHGLGGGSRKTWSRTVDPLHFWPKAWLPEDVNFRDARIHSFGYNADWGERRQSILNIHDFAQSLLGEIKNNPSIRRDNTKLILVGHSMGGCVVKNAYILARQDISCQALAERVHSMFFLGTPHRGSDLAAILQSILMVAWGSKPFVNDLLPNCSILAKINDTSRHYATGLRLWSFYETLPVKMMFVSKLVVEKYSATLGYGNEEISAMDADHRHVCKFDNATDHNYRKIRNALTTAIDMINAKNSDPTPRETISQLGGILGMTEPAYEDDLASPQDLRHPGSCLWFTEEPDLSRWKLGSPNSPPIFWLTGRPATGKSVLCSHVIDQLHTQNLKCSYFFFRHGKAGRSSLADCFHGLAYQMSLNDPTIAQRVLQLNQDGESWDQHDDRVIWRKLFVNVIFRLNTISSHIWVVDALDECVKFSSWFKLLPQLPSGLRLFITSRSTDEIGRCITSLGPRVVTRSLTNHDTAKDMRAYLFSRLEDLSLENVDELCKRILTKSQGSFLWVRLVLQEFESAYTDEDICKKCLMIYELRCAIKLDINETPHNMEKAIPTVCGQLVFIDQASRVHMIHETAREFFLSEDLNSTLAVKRGQRHGHLAQLLCKYLATDAVRTPQGFQPFRGNKPSMAIDTSLVEYAARFFAEHLYRSNSEEVAPMYELCRFLKSNVLYWFELIAQAGDLQPINRTAINLAGYIRRRTKYVPPVDKDIQLVDAWATDLIRVSARFRSKLLSCPSSIHCLIPPFCPTGSIISTLFTTQTRSLLVKGAKEFGWDDCLIRIDFQKGQTTTVAYGITCFAIGMSTGQVSLYDCATFQRVSMMYHPERVRLLEFSRNERFLASAGQKRIVVWETRSSSQIWSSRLVSPPIAMCFPSELLIYANRANQIITSNADTGEILTVSWDGNENNSEIPDQTPNKAAFAPDLGLLAIGYRSHPILIFDTGSGALLGLCSSVKSNGIDAMAFNPNPDISALVVSNANGDLLVFDPQTTELRYQKSNVCAYALACSPDGKSLVTGDSRGTIEVYDFDGPDSTLLTLIYRINSHEESVRSVVFSDDGLRLVDCRESQARVWEPAILLQKDADTGSQSDVSSQVTLAPRTFGTLEDPANPEITSVVCHSDGEQVICGKISGEVALYSAADGQELNVLYGHSRGTSVVAIAMVERQHIVVSADESGRILMADMSSLSSHGLQAAKLITDTRFNSAVFGMLTNPVNDRLLVMGKENDELWELPSGKVISVRIPDENGLRSMIAHPQAPNAFIMFTTTVARVFDWSDFKELTPEMGLPVRRDGLSSSKDTLVNATYHGSTPVIEAVKTVGEMSGTHLFCWDIVSSDSTVDTRILGSRIGLLTPVLRDIIAVVGSTLIFLDKDLWVCSLDLNTFNSAPYGKRHFFILSEWLNVNGDMLYAMTSKKDFVFANKHGLVIVKAGLDFSEVITLSQQQGWTVHSGSMHRRTSNSIIPTNGGTVIFGGVDTKKYSGPLAGLDQSPTSERRTYRPLDSMGLSGTGNADQSFQNNSFPVVFDSEFTFLLADTSYHRAVPLSLATIDRFANITIRAPVSDILGMLRTGDCAFQSLTSGSSNMVINLPFLRPACVWFDQENREISLARYLNCHSGYRCGGSLIGPDIADALHVCRLHMINNKFADINSILALAEHKLKTKIQKYVKPGLYRKTSLLR
ncbi:hypothetical protein F4680DRAFT_449117 [Xylaria scruposa]|nr:hypothetical protein F4680DRAFT_449117 [Xylaria scruposa]